MDGNHDTLINATLLNTLLVCVVVVIHNEALIRLSRVLTKLRQSHHFRLTIAVLGCLTAHALEVWIFATAFYFMHHAEGWGQLLGNFSGTMLDAAYFSFTTFTTLGYGDIEPMGQLRYLTGIEALTGLLMITWSASFLFLEMQRYWPTR
ncbi:potassium channel family protein [Marinobacter daepoensis]|uniref:Two pore domain potassium channel family protein n=1 Tax=Marinobacter daepoensis TaxID=262077 RepID=A0ABS3BA35_9GAMM|nr:two pore domain potassium channel family protein [Marinobacter daepoensis]MBY6079461.1 potassium channel family protein [Marinobacter daepoensis]